MVSLLSLPKRVLLYSTVFINNVKFILQDSHTVARYIQSLQIMSYELMKKQNEELESERAELDKRIRCYESYLRKHFNASDDVDLVQECIRASI